MGLLEGVHEEAKISYKILRREKTGSKRKHMYRKGKGVEKDDPKKSWSRIKQERKVELLEMRQEIRLMGIHQ